MCILTNGAGSPPLSVVDALLFSGVPVLGLGSTFFFLGLLA